MSMVGLDLKLGDRKFSDIIKKKVKGNPVFRMM